MLVKKIWMYVSLVGNAKTTKKTRGMFSGKYFLIFANGRYIINLGKR
jgi:hypothetical protein